MGFRDPIDGIPPSSITADMLADGSVTGTKLSADAIDGKTITGAFIRTAADGKRWELSSTPANEFRGYSGSATEGDPGSLTVDGDDTQHWVLLKTGAVKTGPTTQIPGPEIMLRGTYPDPSTIELDADLVKVGHGAIDEPLTVDRAAATVRVGAVGTATRELCHGAHAAVPDASGDLTVTHNLGGAPTNVQVTLQSAATGSLTFLVHSLTSSTFKVRLFNPATGAVVTTSTRGLYWLAVR